MKNGFTKFLGGGLLASIVASLCCIAPLLAVLGGATGAVTALGWVEPFRPYLIGITAALLAGAWFQLLKKRNTSVDCACVEEEKPAFWKTRSFLLAVTVVALVFLAFPYYADAFYEKPALTAVQEGSVKQELRLQIKGMTCTGCEAHVNQEIGNLPGVFNVNTSYQQESATVTFDSTRINASAIVEVARKTGYTISLQER